MTERASTAREALLAELLGEVHTLLQRVEATRSELAAAEKTTKDTAAALKEANAAYRDQIEDLIKRLRVEFASLLAQTTENAARSLVGQQTAVLQQAAVQAVRQALTAETMQRTRRDWMRLGLASAACGAAGAIVVAVILGVALVFGTR